jgi:hypothetical protein
VLGDESGEMLIEVDDQIPEPGQQLHRAIV